MTEQLLHVNCGGNITHDPQIDSYKCDKCEDAGIAIQHTPEEGEVIILKETTEEEVEQIEEAVADQP
jgi:hypothetical protein